MSQAGVNAAGGGGGSGIEMIDGNVGSVTGSTVTLTTGAANAEGTTLFTGSGSTMTMTFDDVNGNLGIGLNSLAIALTNSAYENTAVGYSTGPTLTGTANTLYGTFAGNLMAEADTNTAFGYQSLSNLVDGAFNLVIGANSGSNYFTNESNNICIGNNVLGTTGESNSLRIGLSTGTGTNQINACFIQGIFNQDSTGFNTPLPVYVDSITGQLGYGSAGGGSGITFLDGTTGTATGSTVTFGITNVLPTYTDGTATFTGSGSTMELGFSDVNQNIGIGLWTLLNISSGTGSGNICIGSQSGQMLTNGGSNTFIGGGSGALLDLGTGNTGIGGALNNLTGINANFNVGVGYLAGNAYTADEAGNISIGTNTYGTRGESFITRIGSSSGEYAMQACYIAGIFGTSTSDVGSTTAVLIDNTGNLGTVASSLRYKENVASMGDNSSFIHELRPVVFNYKKDTKKSLQYGLIAEEVASIAPGLVVSNKDGQVETIKYHDLVPLLLNELQKLRAEVNELKTRLA